LQILNSRTGKDINVSETEHVIFKSFTEIQLTEVYLQGAEDKLTK